MPREVDKIFVKQPIDPRGRGLDPPGPLGPSRPLGYFGLPMMNLGRPPLPPNKPYCQPFNYPEYVKDYDSDVHVKGFKIKLHNIVTPLS
jgi:hypothetical protein